MATHSSNLSWRNQWTEEPDRLQSVGVAKSRTQLSMRAVTNEAGQFCMFVFLSFICISSLKYLLTSFAYFSLGRLFSYN